MASTSKAKPRRTYVYRRCVFTPKVTQTLQQLVAGALLQHVKPANRLEPLNPQSTELRGIGRYSNVGDVLVGYLVAFERGATQMVVGDDPHAASLLLNALPPPSPSKGGVQQQYLPGAIYFAIHGNHLVLVQSASIRSGALEAHLSWLLKSKTSQLPVTTGMALSDEAQKVTKEKIKKAHVKSIALGRPLMEESAPVPQSDGQVAASPRKGGKPPKQFRAGGPSLEFLRSLFTSQSDFEKLGLDEVFDGNLEVWVEIRYPKHTRSKPEGAMCLMDSLGLALRDKDQDEIRLELGDGSVVRGKELKISTEMDVEILRNGLPDEDKLWASMAQWLLGVISNGIVDP